MVVGKARERARLGAAKVREPGPKRMVKPVGKASVSHERQSDQGPSCAHAVTTRALKGSAPESEAEPDKLISRALIHTGTDV